MNLNEQHIAERFEGRGLRVLRNGWPDFLVIDEQRHTGFAVEVKTGKDRVTLDQAAIHKYLTMLGVPIYVVRDGKIADWKGVKLLAKPVIARIKYELDFLRGIMMDQFGNLRDKFSEIEEQLRVIESAEQISVDAPADGGGKQRVNNANITPILTQNRGTGGGGGS